MKQGEHTIGDKVQFEQHHVTLVETVEGVVTGIVVTSHISEFGVDTKVEYQIEQENKCRHKIPAEYVTKIKEG